MKPVTTNTTGSQKHGLPTTGHTPGPWTAIFFGERPQSVSAVNGAISVCSFNSTLYKYNPEQAKANASLIEAATDLLAVLIQLLPVAEETARRWPNDLHFTEKCDAARSAIAKAKGKA